MPLSIPHTETRRIGIVVDLNDESLHAVMWAVSNYLCPDDTVLLLHVQPTSALYGADWGDMVRYAGAMDVDHDIDDGLDILTSSQLVRPLQDSNIPYKVHTVKDFDVKERICLEAERLKLTAMIMGSPCTRSKTGPDSISDYCVHHCECPVVVVPFRASEKVDLLTNEAASMHLDSKI